MIPKIRKPRKPSKWYPRDHMRKDILYHARKHPDQKKLVLIRKKTRKMKICPDCKRIVFTRR